MHRWTVDGLPYECEVVGFKVEKVITAVYILACAAHLRSLHRQGAAARAGSEMASPACLFSRQRANGARGFRRASEGKEMAPAARHALRPQVLA
jgi:hypothetical protein